MLPSLLLERSELNCRVENWRYVSFHGLVYLRQAPLLWTAGPSALPLLRHVQLPHCRIVC